jgi:hypothetical protein
MVNMKEACEPFKFLRQANKDIQMNHHLFITSRGRRNDTETHLKDISAITLFIRDALEKVFEEKKWIRNKIDMEKQVNEASFIVRHVLKSLPVLLSDAEQEKVN